LPLALVHAVLAQLTRAPPPRQLTPTLAATSVATCPLVLDRRHV